MYDPLTDSKQQRTSNPSQLDNNWTDNPDVQSTLERARIKPPASQEYDTCTTETLLSSPTLLQWYRNQSNRAISRTGIVDTALVLAQHGASSRLVGLEEVGEDLSLLSHLVYDIS